MVEKYPIQIEYVAINKPTPWRATMKKLKSMEAIRSATTSTWLTGFGKSPELALIDLMKQLPLNYRSVEVEVERASTELKNKPTTSKLSYNDRKALKAKRFLQEDE